MHSSRDSKYMRIKLAEMASKSSSSKKKLIIISLALLLFTATFNISPLLIEFLRLKYYEPSEGTYRPLIQNPKWYDIVAPEAMDRKIKIGLVNMDEIEEEDYTLHGLAETIMVRFDRVAENQQWPDYLPASIDEDEKSSKTECPKMPMPSFADYGEMDVVVARVPCGSGKENRGIRDLFRLQVNLVVANLVVVNGWMNHDVDRTVYVVFIGSCGPMREIFRCDDLLSHEGDYWVYRPDLRRLKQKVLLPVGTCQHDYSLDAKRGKQKEKISISQSTLSKFNNIIYQQPREAYVTVLHSSDDYVCGAIALAQSIIQTNTTKDLVLLADDFITKKSLQGLKAAGWKIKRIKRIKSTHAKEGAYNEWNYSKFRVWQLTEYDKVIFLDVDILVFRNIDAFFVHPQLSATVDISWRAIFNSGIMVLEPSECMFETLMEKRYTLPSYTGGDQGFLNEVFTWWHRLPTRLNHFTRYISYSNNPERVLREDAYAVHYFGWKPWMCYRDYDCNWDRERSIPYASDSAHRRWWQMYDAMPRRLQSYCALTKAMDAKLRLQRELAKNASLRNGHWKIKVMDPRQHYLS